MRFLLRWLGCFVGVLFAIWVTPGVSTTGSSWVPAVTVALFLALINLSIKPLAQVLSLPVTLLSLGAFALVVNALMFELANWLTISMFGEGLVIASFSSALVASVLVSIVSTIMNGLTGARG